MPERYTPSEFSAEGSEKKIKKLEKMVNYQDWSNEVENIISSTPEGQDYREYAIDQAIDRMKARLPNMHDDLDKELLLLKSREYSDKDEFIQILTKTLLDFITSRFTARSLGDHDRANIDNRNQERVVWLGRLVHCEIVDKSVILHVAPGRDFEPVELLRELKNSLQVLAEKLMNDPKYAEIETVTGTSWIIAKNPKLLERLGFNIEGPITLEERAAHFVDEEREIWTARISKQDLINKYSGQTK